MSVARESSTKYQYISYTAHRILHYQSFYDFMKRILDYKCTKCDGQRGFNCIENNESGVKSGHSVVFNIHCDNPKCNALLYKTYESSPRVSVSINKKDDGKVLEISPAKQQDQSESYVLYGLLQNLVLLHHGAQNSELETMSQIYDLPIYGSKTVTRDKTGAAKIMEFWGDTAVQEAQGEEEKIIKNSSDETVTTRHSMDGAYFNVVIMMQRLNICMIFVILLEKSPVIRLTIYCNKVTP